MDSYFFHTNTKMYLESNLCSQEKEIVQKATISPRLSILGWSLRVSNSTYLYHRMKI